jgi:hypothetical protein
MAAVHGRAEGIIFFFFFFFFQAGGMALALYPRQELAKAANVAPEGHGFHGISLACNLHHRSEVDTLLKKATAASATVVKPAQQAFWGGYPGHFADPDGWLWEVAWNPAFPIAEGEEWERSDS